MVVCCLGSFFVDFFDIRLLFWRGFQLLISRFVVVLSFGGGLFGLFFVFVGGCVVSFP